MKISKVNNNARQYTIMMENYHEKAKENFYRNRPYGIHIDYARK